MLNQLVTSLQFPLYLENNIVSPNVFLRPPKLTPVSSSTASPSPAPSVKSAASPSPSPSTVSKSTQESVISACTDKVSGPPAEGTNQVSGPPAEATSQVSGPQAEATNQASGPPAEATIQASGPQAEATNQMSGALAAYTNKVSQPPADWAGYPPPALPKGEVLHIEPTYVDYDAYVYAQEVKHGQL